jgi:hypothetical protein
MTPPQFTPSSGDGRIERDRVPYADRYVVAIRNSLRGTQS